MTGGWLVLLVLVLIAGAFVVGFCLGAVIPDRPPVPEAVRVIREMQDVHDATMTALASTGLAVSTATTTPGTAPPRSEVIGTSAPTTPVNTPRQRDFRCPPPPPPPPGSIPGSKPVVITVESRARRKAQRRAARAATSTAHNERPANP